MSLSGAFTPCRYLRPFSGREHNYQLIQSGDDCLMNETRRKPTTGTRCPTLFDTWHGIFYMPSRTDTVGHNTKVFDYQVVDHWGARILKCVYMVNVNVCNVMYTNIRLCVVCVWYVGGMSIIFSPLQSFRSLYPPAWRLDH